MQSNHDTGNYNDVDPAQGHVSYLSKDDAFDLGLVSYQGDEMYLGVDHKTKLNGAGYPGRNSVRIESQQEYNHGLFIARFSHLPDNKCGAWPAL